MMTGVHDNRALTALRSRQMFGQDRGGVTTDVDGTSLTNRARTGPHFGVTKRESHSDSNADYVDEHTTGVFANPAHTSD